MAQVYRELIRCEMLREKVFAGKKKAPILGVPTPWADSMQAALADYAQGNFAQGAKQRDQALEQAPARVGSVNGQAFEWMSDADSRLGPIFEVVMNGQYYWLPQTEVVSIDLDVPEDLRDLVWLPGKMKMVNDEVQPIFMPVRYPGMHAGLKDDLALSRLTEWTCVDEPTDLWAGQGQRMFSTDSEEYSLLDLREIRFSA